MSHRCWQRGEAHLVHALSQGEKDEFLDLIAQLCIEGNQKAVAVAIIANSPLFIVRRSDLIFGESHVVSERSLEAAPRS